MESTAAGINVLIVHGREAENKLLNRIFLDCTIPIKKVSHLNSIKSTLRFLKNDSVDIIFLDFDLTDESGIQVFMTIQSYSRQIPIVILTGAENTSLALLAINKGAQDFLVNTDLEKKLLGKPLSIALKENAYPNPCF